MLFSNTFVSFIAAITLAGSVTAIATPRDSCSTGTLTCCDSTSYFESLPEFVQSDLISALDPNVVANVPIGLNCAAAGILGCSNTAFCCDGTQKMNGFVNVGVNCVNV